MKSIALFLLLVLTNSLFAQDSDSIIVSPQNLDEALLELEFVYPDSTKELIRTLTEDEYLSKTHFTIGLYIRKQWLYEESSTGITRQSSLRKNLYSIGILKNDDMSELILRSYYRQLMGEELRIGEQIKVYQGYYFQSSNSDITNEGDSESYKQIMPLYNIGDSVQSMVYLPEDSLGNVSRRVKVIAVLNDKSDTKLNITITSFGEETKVDFISQSLRCLTKPCWVEPFQWNPVIKKSN